MTLPNKGVQGQFGSKVQKKFKMHLECITFNLSIYLTNHQQTIIKHFFHTRNGKSRDIMKSVVPSHP